MKNYGPLLEEALNLISGICEEKNSTVLIHKTSHPFVKSHKFKSFCPKLWKFIFLWSADSFVAFEVWASHSPGLWVLLPDDKSVNRPA